MAREACACGLFKRAKREGGVRITRIFPKEERPAGRAKASPSVIGGLIPPDLPVDLYGFVDCMRGGPEMAGLAPTLTAMADGEPFGLYRHIECDSAAQTATFHCKLSLLTTGRLWRTSVVNAI
jgi:hypothetical protein